MKRGDYVLTCEICHFYDDERGRCHAQRKPIERHYRDPICRYFQPWEKACHCCRFAVEDGKEYYCLHGYYAWAVPWGDEGFRKERALSMDDDGGCLHWDGRTR